MIRKAERWGHFGIDHLSQVWKIEQKGSKYFFSVCGKASAFLLVYVLSIHVLSFFYVLSMLVGNSSLTESKDFLKNTSVT